MSQNTPEWTKLDSFQFTKFGKLTFINNDEFIVCPLKRGRHNGDGIWKYDIKQQKWMKLIDYGETYKVHSHSAVFDANYNCAYLFGTLHGNIIQLDLNEDKLNIIESGTNTQGLRLVIVGDRLHGVGGWTPIHLSWDAQSDKLTDKKIHKLSESLSTGIRGHSLIYLKSQKCILLFGGKSSPNTKRDSIHKYSIITQKWTELDIKMPMAMSSFGIVKTRNERYIILFGGWVAKAKCNYIHIYDTKMKAWIKSSITTPISSIFRATISKSPQRDERLCFGYIRNCYNQDCFINLKKLPCYLMQFISQWISNEIVFLMEYKCIKDEKGSSMWCMNIDDILQNTA